MIRNYFITAFRHLRKSDSLSQVIVNEAFVKSNNWETAEQAIGKNIELWDHTLPIVGVVRDFHTQSLRERIEPTIIVDDARNLDMAAIKLRSGNIQTGLKEIEKTWASFFPEYDFDYRFAEEEIAEFYESEQKLSDIIGMASLVIIFIGCLGMYGLVTFMAEQKTKEVGIRKVLGATIMNIVSIFSWEFIKLVVIAFLIAAPVAYFFMDHWLRSFAFQIPLGIDIFLLGITVTLVIALLTVSYQTFKSATVNPVDSLKRE